MKKHKIGAIASVGALALGAFAYISPAYADAPDCSAVDTQVMLNTCIDGNIPITLGGDISLTSNIVVKGGHRAMIDLNGHDIIREGNSVAFQVRKGILVLEGTGNIKRIGQDSTNSRATIRIYGETTAQDFPTSILSVGPNVSIINNDDAAIYIEDNEDGSQYGIQVDFAGSASGTEGIVVSKNINITDGMPLINVADGANIDAENHAIVAEGFADWNIGRATLQADTGIALVQGRFYIDDATVTASGVDNSQIVPNSIVKMPNTGAAIQIQSTLGKTDKSSFYVRSGHFSSENGYAIAEYAANDSSKAITLKDLKIYTGNLHGSSDIAGNSIATSTTGALFWYHGDGRMMEAGSYGIEDNPDLYDPHNMTVVRYANSIDGIEGIYADERYDFVEEIFPVYTPFASIDEYEEEALRKSEYKNSNIINAAMIRLFLFEKDFEPVEMAPGTSKPYTIPTDTGEDHPITFNMPFPEIDGVKDGYIRQYYMLNFHQTDISTGEYEIEKLPIEFSEDGKSYSFSTHKFSTFALAYEDIEIPHVPDSGAVSPFTSVLPTLRFFASL